MWPPCYKEPFLSPEQKGSTRSKLRFSVSQALVLLLQRLSFQQSRRMNFSPKALWTMMLWKTSEIWWKMETIFTRRKNLGRNQRDPSQVFERYRMIFLKGRSAQIWINGKCGERTGVPEELPARRRQCFPSLRGCRPGRHPPDFPPGGCHPVAAAPTAPASSMLALCPSAWSCRILLLIALLARQVSTFIYSIPRTIVDIIHGHGRKANVGQLPPSPLLVLLRK